MKMNHLLSEFNGEFIWVKKRFRNYLFGKFKFCGKILKNLINFISQKATNIVRIG